MNPFPLLNKSWINSLHCNNPRPVRDPANIRHIANTSSLSITAIPEDDVLPIVFSYLSFNDLVSLEKTCRLFHRVIRKNHLKESAFFYNLFKNTDTHKEAGFDYWADREYQRLKDFFTANNHQVLAIPARKKLKEPFLHFHMLRELIYSHAYEFKLVMQFPNKASWTHKLSPCGRFLLTQNSKDHLEMWRCDAMCNRQMVARVPQNYLAKSPVFSRTGRDLMTFTFDNGYTIFIWSIDNNQNWRQTAQINFKYRLECSIFSPSGYFALFYCLSVCAPGERDEGRNVRVWGRDRQGCWTEQKVIEHDNEIMGVKIDPTDQHILSHSRDNIIKIHSRDNAGNWLPSGVIYHQDRVKNPCFSACGRHILTNSNDLTARIWSCNDHGKWVEQQIVRHSEGIRHAIFSDSGRSVATCAGSTLSLWAYTGQWLQQATPLCNEIITSIQFSPSEHLVVGTRKGRIMLLDCLGGVQHLVERGAGVCRTIFSASGNRAVTTLHNATAIIWSLNTHGSKKEGFMHHDGKIKFVYFLQQDRQILSWTGSDGKVKVWSHCDDGTWKNSTVIELDYTRYFYGLENIIGSFSSREHLLYTHNNEIWGHDEKGCWRRKGKIPFACPISDHACFLPCQSRLLLHNQFEMTEEIWEIFPTGEQLK